MKIKGCHNLCIIIILQRGKTNKRENKFGNRAKASSFDTSGEQEGTDMMEARTKRASISSSEVGIPTANEFLTLKSEGEEEEELQDICDGMASVFIYKYDVTIPSHFSDI